MGYELSLHELKERKNLAKRMRRPFEVDWLLNMAFIAGEQYVRWAGDPANKLVEVDRVETEVYPVHNICIKISRTEAAKILKTRPVPVALPVSDSEDDHFAARVLDAYFHYLQDEWNFDRRMRHASQWLVATGNVFFKWYWAGGCNRVAVVSPFDIYPDPYAKTMLDWRWVHHSEFMDAEAARDKFKGFKGVDLSAIQETSTDSLSPVETRVWNSFGNGVVTLPGVVLNEYWEIPSPSCPKGRFQVWTEHGIVYSSPYPYSHGRIPFTHAGNIERHNSKWHASVIDFVRPLNEELNRAEKQLIENRGLANGKYFIPVEVELDQEITSDARQQIRWAGSPNWDPRSWFVQPQGMASWVAGEPERIKATAQDIAIQREVSNAGVPGRVESGQAIQLLQESDDSVVAFATDSINEAVADGFLMTAYLYKQFGEEEVAVRAYDKDGMIEVQQLKQDVVPLNLRVRTQTTTGLPQTVAGKWDRVLNLLQYKVIDEQKALKMLDLSSEEPDLDPFMQDRKNAYRENKHMLKKVIVRAKPWDDHDLHLEELDKFRKTEEYRRAVEVDPKIEENFAFHEAEHKQLRALKDQEEVQREILLSGGAPPPEGGGGDEITEPAPPEPADNGSPAPVA